MRRYRSIMFTRSSNKFSKSVENEQAGAGRNATAEPVSRDQILRREHADREKNISPIQLNRSRIGNLTGLLHTLLQIRDELIYIP